MPRIFDNIEQDLCTAVRSALAVSYRADFCVGYFNLRGWKLVGDIVEAWSGAPNNRVRLLIGMQPTPEDQLREALRISGAQGYVDQAAVVRAKKQCAEALRRQLLVGLPTAEDERALRSLAQQLRAGKVVVKLFLSHPLHAKLYLMFRQDPLNPAIAFVGSSNLTLAGLAKQGELNVDVLDGDATQKLADWFEHLWNDRWCVDISAELASIILESWAREEPIPPYLIYLKMAYHLSEEAREGVAEFRLPDEFKMLCEHQVKAVQIAAAHLNRRGGVIVGDVVGLGKTLVGTALARIFEDDRGAECLILCPKNLEGMWEDHRARYHLRGRVLSTSRALKELPRMPRYRLVLIDESHNFRNREGKIYRAVAEYIERNESACILLTATPYNKSYLDLANQLRLFIPEDRSLGIRPEALIRSQHITNFSARYQCAPDTLAAFEKSDDPDDWRELLRRYMVRRTRSFVFQNYGKQDEEGRLYLELSDGTRSYCATREAKAVRFEVDAQFARLYSDEVVTTINALHLARYGLGLHLADPPPSNLTEAEKKVIENLSRAGRRLVGFCRTNLFKRLESSGHAFLLSVRRHILRNQLFLYALANNLPIPIGTQDPEMLDTRVQDQDVDGGDTENDEDEQNNDDISSDLARSAEELYKRLHENFRRRFRWVRPALFDKNLARLLEEDNERLRDVLALCPKWDSTKDAKLNALRAIVTEHHPSDKILVFTQFADTADYLVEALQHRDVEAVEGCTGSTYDPTAVARRFSPKSNNAGEVQNEIRVLVATDVLSEGQNLQDAHVVVSYDLPWAIIRLIQRVGRVDRIGQESQVIYCYSFLPADGVEKLIRLRARLRERLRENAEVVGTDERFFDDDRNDAAVADLYNEKAGILDEDEGEIDLASRAFEVWNRATKDDPTLRRMVETLPDVVYSTKPLYQPNVGANAPAENDVSVPHMQTVGDVLVYVRTTGENHALIRVGSNGEVTSHSAVEVFEAAECDRDTRAVQPLSNHHELVASGVKTVVTQQRYVGGQLGRPSGARFRTYTRLKTYVQQVKGTLFGDHERIVDVERAIEDIYRYPLTEHARDALNRQLRSGISDEALVEMVLQLRNEGRLCQLSEEQDLTDAQVICSLGIRPIPLT